MSRWTIHGARGSYAVSGQRYRRYGGSTSSFSLETDRGILVIDAGTSLAALGESLSQRERIPPITILFTHFHLDHVVGLPAFKPLFKSGVHITLMADPTIAGDWQRMIQTLVSNPFWPVALLESGAAIRLENLPPAGSSHPIELYGSEISWCQVAHPQGCVNYRIRADYRTVVVATDREHGDAALDAAFLEFCRGADVLIHDAQNIPEEQDQRCGWGHSTWQQSAEVALASGASTLILTSHDPSRSDEAIDQIVQQARERFPHTTAASEGMIVS